MPGGGGELGGGGGDSCQGAGGGGGEAAVVGELSGCDLKKTDGEVDAASLILKTSPGGAMDNHLKEDATVEPHDGGNKEGGHASSSMQQPEAALRSPPTLRKRGRPRAASAAGGAAPAPATPDEAANTNANEQAGKKRLRLSKTEQLKKRVDFLNDVIDIPVLYPDEREFASPLQYISSPHVQALGKQYGVISIQPPKWWQDSADENAAIKRLSQAPSVRDGFRVYRQVVGHNSVSWMPSGDDSVRTFDEFRKRADESLKEHFKLDDDAPQPSPSEVETKYWEKLLSASSTPVEYGGDLLASAFDAPQELSHYERLLWDLGEEEELITSSGPLAKATGPAMTDSDTTIAIDGKTEGQLMRATEQMAYTPWNLRLFAFLPGCINLQKFMGCHALRGVTTPYAYIGAPFASFAWHVEDHHLFSVNYHHAGAPKTWYGVPADHADLFETVMETRVFSSSRSKKSSSGQQDDDRPTEKPADAKLEAKNVLTSLRPLLKSRVKVGRVVQTAGRFVVTFPRAYHAGFSHGFNIGEAVNFGTESWIDYGRKAALRYKQRGRPTSEVLFDHDKLMRIRDEYFQESGDLV